MQALFVVFVGFALRFGGLAISLDFFLGAEAAVRAALFDQLPRVLGVEVAALGLDIRAVIAADIRTFVIGQARLTHGLVNQIDRAGHFALLIGIFDAQNELAAVLLGEQIGIQRGAQAAPDADSPSGWGQTLCELHQTCFFLLKRERWGLPHTYPLLIPACSCPSAAQRG